MQPDTTPPTSPPPPPSPARAASFPTLRLISGTQFARVDRWGTDPISIPQGVWVAAVGGAFRLEVDRPTWESPIRVTQTSGSASRVLPAWVAKDFNGLRGFMDVTVTQGRDVVYEGTFDFCPNAWERSRLDPSGPTRSPFPDYCSSGSGNPFVMGTVWGIPTGWASPAISWSMWEIPSFEGPDGTYTATFTIAERYRTLLGIGERDATARLDFGVHTMTCGDWCYGEGGMKSRDTAPARSLTRSPILSSAPTSGLPDLVPMPAWSITLDAMSGHESLGFSTTIANLGDGPLWVEGFRMEGDGMMDAWQYFRRDGRVVGRMPVGTFHFDERRDHQHWHFMQFASFALLDAAGHEVVPGTKEAWCLAPTDAIDLLLPGAELRPGTTDFSLCGGREALWVRESLPTGWADTYWNGLAGQSFDISGLPNGKYLIRFTVNPMGALHESDTTNNVVTRAIRIKGKPGQRFVVAQPWNGIEA